MGCFGLFVTPELTKLPGSRACGGGASNTLWQSVVPPRATRLTAVFPVIIWASNSVDNADQRRSLGSKRKQRSTAEAKHAE